MNPSTQPVSHYSSTQCQTVVQNSHFCTKDTRRTRKRRRQGTNTSKAGLSFSGSSKSKARNRKASLHERCTSQLPLAAVPVRSSFWCSCVQQWAYARLPG